MISKVGGGGGNRQTHQRIYGLGVGGGSLFGGFGEGPVRWWMVDRRCLDGKVKETNESLMSSTQLGRRINGEWRMQRTASDGRMICGYKRRSAEDTNRIGFSPPGPERAAELEPS